MGSADDVEAPWTVNALGRLLDLGGRRVVVTGGASGIGLATSALLIECGARVVLADRDLPKAKVAAERVGGDGNCRAIRLDVTAAESVRKGLREASEWLRGINALVNCAGIYPPTEFLRMTEEQWDEVMQVNLRGPFLCASHACRDMIEHGEGGVIVNVSSTASRKVAGPGFAHYTASKSGLEGLTRSLAVELAPHNIRVISVAPGVTHTPGLRNLQDELTRLDLAPDARLANPLAEEISADEVARVIVFCISDLAAMITGSTVIVDGGRLA